MRLFHYLAILTFGISTLQAEWTVEKTMRVRNIADVEVSPDGNEAIYTVITSQYEGDENAYKLETFLQSLNLRNSPTLIDTNGLYAARWSPDGRQIAFLKQEGESANLYLMERKSQQITQLTKSSTPIQSFRWSPDSSMIAFVQKSEEKSSDNPYSNSTKSKPLPTHLKCISIENKKITTLTDSQYYVVGIGDFRENVESFDWSPDSKEIAFTYTERPSFNDYHVRSHIAVVDIKSKDIRLFATGCNERSPIYSPDGKWIAYLKSPRKGTFTCTMELAITSTNGKNTLRPPQTDENGPFIAGKALLDWSADGEELYYFEPYKTRFRIVAISAFGNTIREIDLSNILIRSPRLNTSKSHLAFVGQSSSVPPEAYISTIDGKKTVKLTQLNQEFLADPVAKTELFQWIAPDGKIIEGLLTYPKQYMHGKRYPLLVEIHGGPMGSFTETYIGRSYLYPTAVFAEKGYFIFRPNIRGSCGYGKEFREANVKDWGGGDYQDFMSGIDELIRHEFIDPNRIGLMGWSFGGYMTSWAVTQTDRFKLASAGAGPTNLMSMVGTSDIPSLVRNYFEIDFTSDPSLYIERSPIFHVHKVKTPLLIQHGKHDDRVPVSQSHEFYEALRYHRKKADLIIYHNAKHVPLDPKTWMQTAQDNIDWFENMHN